MKKRTSIPILVALSCFAAYSLEIKGGRIKLDFSEENGKFNISFLDDVAKNAYKTFFLEQIPPTSSITLMVNSKTFKLGESPDFRIKTKTTDSGGEIEFRSSFCVLRETVSFISSEPGILADGVKIAFSIENLEDKDQVSGLKILLDTYSGETNGPHFSTDLRPRIQEELVIGPQDADKYWASLWDGDSGFQFMITAAGATRPDTVVFANWKRLDEAAWSIDSSPSRNFNMLPYSVNDSAASIFYEPKTIPRAGQREIVVLMGHFSTKGFSQSNGKQKIETGISNSVLGKPAEDKKLLIQTDLIAVRDVIAKLNKMLASGQALSAEDISSARQVLEQLKTRKKSY